MHRTALTAGSSPAGTPVAGWLVLWGSLRRAPGSLPLVGLLVNVAIQPPAAWLSLAAGWPFLLVEGLV